jgi:hypothetical protein
MEDHKRFVYILSNSVHTGTIKIGCTHKEHPESRAEKLSKQTGAIGKYKCEWYKEVLDDLLAERFLHIVFSPFHFEKEYFEIEKAKAISLAEKAIKDLSDLLNKYALGDEESLRDALAGLEILAEENKNDEEVNEGINFLKEKIEIGNRMKK